MQTFHHRRATWEDWLPALVQSVGVLVLAAWLVTRSPNAGGRMVALIAGVMAGAAYLAGRSLLQAGRVLLSAKNVRIDIDGQTLRITDWRGTVWEANWEAVSLVPETSRLRLECSTRDSRRYTISIGAREFEDGHRLLSELAAHCPTATRTVSLTPLPPEGGK